MKRFNLQSPKKQQGLTLIELTLGIATVLIVIAIGIVVYNSLQQSTRSYSGEEGLLSLVAAVKGLNPQATYTVTHGTIITAKKAPSNMINGAALQNPWGGTITVAPANYNGGTANAYVITYLQVPAAECNSMVSAVAPNFPLITVNTVAQKDDAAATPVVLNINTLATNCNTSNNTIAFTGV